MKCMMRRHFGVVISIILLSTAFTPVLWAAELSQAEITTNSKTASEPNQLPQGLTDSPLLNSRFILFGSESLRRQTLRWAKRRGNPDMVPALIYALRYHEEEERREVLSVLQRLAKKRIGDDWAAWMRWQQKNEANIQPFEGFEIFQSALFSGLDPEFGDFIYRGVRSKIRMEEIVWGGVSAKDGIPPLTNPPLIDATEAQFMSDSELVFGISINGDVRAYPYRFMDWHEMLNDVIGGQPVSLAYCTLCGSGILFDTTVPGRQAPLVFGSSGFLYRSNKLMFDRATDSLWNQFTGKPVVGALVDSGIELETLPLVTTTWGKWRTANPGTRVMSMDTGFARDYRPGKPYGAYFASSRLMFPVATDDRRLKQKQEVFGMRISGHARAWPLNLFKKGRVIHDRLGVVDIVLIGHAKTRTVRAYRSEGRMFEQGKDQPRSQVSSEGQIWQVEEDALHGPNGERLTRLPGHLAYWFAWHNYLGPDTLYEAARK